MLKPLLNLTPSELIDFVNDRRTARLLKVYKTLKKKPEELTVASIAKDLGLAKEDVLKKLEKELL